MRVLFAMAYPGYLRYFDTTVAELARRGHTVTLAFESPKHQHDGLQALDPSDPRISVAGAVPTRRDTWDPVARHLRRISDYLRYLDPRFADAAYLRQRAGAVLPEVLRSLRGVDKLDQRRWRLALRALLAAEMAIPTAARLDSFVEEQQPDVVVLTPLVTDASRQNDLVKSARKSGIPTVLAVASWDHLTTKGRIRVEVDRVLVWNDVQRDEAVSLHGIPADRVVVTGAQPFDRWFDRAPSLTPAAFRDKVGLPADGDLVLFVGSTVSISSPDAEERWVRDWLRALRASDEPRLRDAAVLIRPHPYNLGRWADADFEGLGPVAVWPREQVSIVDEDNRRDYFDSLFHAGAVVGINTSAMVEAAVVGRPVLSVLTSEFRDRQEGSLHFQYLRRDRGGCVVEAASLSEHLPQLAQVLAGATLERGDFVHSFVRPHGLDKAATPRVADAIEQAAAIGTSSATARTPATAIALRPFVWVAGMAIEWGTPAQRRHYAGVLRARLYGVIPKGLRGPLAAIAGGLRAIACRLKRRSAREGSP